jgi:phenylalanyl-tRNA synthetase beta chain
MKVSYTWLKDYVVTPLSVEEIAESLTGAGLQVEGIHRQAYNFQGVIVGQIQEIQKHPQSDKLFICRVEAGPGREFFVVCGASNIAVGAKVPLALEGAELPDGTRITSSKIRGILSQGMICSEKELGLSEVADRIMILSEQAPVGVPLSEVLPEQDVILEIAITPNRGDCLSLIGIAREVAALTGGTLKKPSITLQARGEPISRFTSVTIQAPSLCPRYTASLIRNVAIKPSPAWLKNRLEAVGIRSINNVVDVTNYVMMELGQPLHAFDFDKLEDHRIVVRQAGENERLKTLDGVERILDPEMLVIADGKRAIGIAGVMGGLNTEVEETSRQILLESAFFSPESIRKTSKKLGLRTEASYRFERGVDPLGTPVALKRATQLIQEVAGGEIASGIIDEFPVPFSPTRLSLRAQRARQILGADLSVQQMRSILTSLEFSVSEQPNEILQVEVPSHRSDITREIDLIEEVGRIHGYDKISPTLPSGRIVPQDEKISQKVESLIQQILIGEGFYEVINYSFMSKSALDKLKIPESDYRRRTVTLENPIIEEQNQLRTTLVPHLLQNACLNFKYHDSLRLFEISRVFINREGYVSGPDGEAGAAREMALLPEEPVFVAGIMGGYREEVYWGEARKPVTFYDLKGVLENIFSILKVSYRLRNAQIPFLHPGQSAEIQIERQAVGYLGKIHPEVAEIYELDQPLYLFEINLGQIVPHVRTSVSFKPLPKFPSVRRDLAILVPLTVRAEDIETQIRNVAGPILEEVKLFDLYQGEQIAEGFVSLAYSLIYRNPDRTLTDSEVNLVHSQIIQSLERTLGARLRE